MDILISGSMCWGNVLKYEQAVSSILIEDFIAALSALK